MPVTIEPVLCVSFVVSVLWEDKNLLRLSLVLECTQVCIIPELPWVPVEQDFLAIIFRAAQFLDLFRLHSLVLQPSSEIKVSVSHTHLITFDNWFYTLLCCCVLESNGTRSSCSLKCQCFASCFILLDSFSPGSGGLEPTVVVGWLVVGLCLPSLSLTVLQFPPSHEYITCRCHSR